jgi:MFS family permease
MKNGSSEVASGDCRVKRSLLGKDFVFASLGYFFAFFSISAFYLFPLFLDRFHPSKSRVGLIMGIHSVTAIMVRPLIGRILDKRGGRSGAIIGLLIMIAVMPGFYFIRSAGLLAFLLRALNGIGWGMATTAILAICSDFAPRDRLAHVLGVIGAAGIVSQAIGPTVAEEIFRRYDFTAVFHLSVVMLAAALLCVVVIKGAPLVAVRAKIQLKGMTVYPLMILLVIAAMPIAHGAARGTVLNFIALFGASMGFDRIGPFFLAFSVAAVITRLGLGDLSDRYGRKRVILPAALLIGFNLFWIAGAHSYWSFVMNGFVAGFGQGLIFPALSTYMIDFMGRGNKGLALGLYLSLFDVGMGIGSPLFGWISDAAGGYRLMYVVAGCLVLVLTVVFSIKAPSIAISSSENQDDSRGIIEP